MKHALSLLLGLTLCSSASLAKPSGTPKRYWCTCRAGGTVQMLRQHARDRLARGSIAAGRPRQGRAAADAQPWGHAAAHAAAYAAAADTTHVGVFARASQHHAAGDAVGSCLQCGELER